MKTNTIRLIRQTTDGKAVPGILDLPLDKDTLRIATLENADFLIPAGIYTLEMSWSPRFKKQMPEICDVPGREGIRIHQGTVPEHSRGCVLVSAFALGYITFAINKFYKEHDEDDILQIEIC